MAKFARKQLPPGLAATDFLYQGRPAKDQGDFGSDVGIVDMVCCKQFDQNSDKFYHAGVVVASGRWFVYTEWGRRKAHKSWDGTFLGQDFMFQECSDERAARKEFEKICMRKNWSRITKNALGIWVSKTSEDGYFVQSLATRLTGLPNAYVIKDSESLPVKALVEEKKPKTTKKTASLASNYHPEEIRLHNDLIGGMASYVQTVSSAAGGVLPTLSAIKEVRDLLPQAMIRIAEVGKTVRAKSGESTAAYDRRLALSCTRDKDLQDLSLYVASRVPRPAVSISADAETRALATILSSGNILDLQADLDVFESTLGTEDFSVKTVVQKPTVDIDKSFNASVRWIDPKSEKGQWVEQTYRGFYNPSSHDYVRGKKLVIRNMFEVVRPDRDQNFIESVSEVAKKRLGKFSHFAKSQPPSRKDLEDLGKNSQLANVFMGLHGTRAVNVAPILKTNFRLPKSLPGAMITGAAFGHGLYFSTNTVKSYNYTGFLQSYWTSGGTISGRGFFLFLCDVIFGDAFMTTSTGSWDKPPQGKDSVVAFPEFCRTLKNDEYIIFDPNYQRVRYLVEAEFI